MTHADHHDPHPTRGAGHDDAHPARGAVAGGHGYGKLALELLADFAIMYLVMYAMIATLAHFRFNLNTVYMTLMMVSPMAILMVLAMWKMYPSRRVNLAIIAVAAAVFLGSFAAIRWQVGAGDRELLRAMIPHHSGALTMCGEAELTDAEVRDLCTQIIRSQREEIAQMERILARL